MKQAVRRGGARGGRGGFTKASAQKRSSPDSEDAPSRANKKSKSSADDETATLVPKIEVDDNKDKFVAVSFFSPLSVPRTGVF